MMTGVAALMLTAGLTTLPAAAATGSDPSLSVQDASGNHAMGSSIAVHDGVPLNAPLSTSVRPNVSSSSMTPGMDVSAYQPSPNWSADYANGARFAYIKATEGTSYISSSFSSQYANSFNAGLMHGAYVYAQPTQASGVATANYFYAHGGGWSPDGRTLPPLLDIEYGNSTQGTCYGMSTNAMVIWISDFVNAMHNLTGVWPAIYTTAGWWSQCTGDNAHFPLDPFFVAHYTTASTPGTLGASWATWTMWQWADSGTFEGDQDVFNGDQSALQSYANGSAPVSSAPVTRIAGDDASGTSAALSASTFPANVNTVFIATRSNFPDALAGAAAAGKQKGPILLVDQLPLSSALTAELKRLAPQHIVVLGGADAVSDAIVSQLQTFTPGRPVQREAGTDRYDTAATIAADNWGTSASTVYLATGSNYPDAVAASSIAASSANSGPVLLTDSSTLSPAAQSEIQKLNPNKVVILGGTTAVSTAVEASVSSTLGTLGNSGTVVRIAGSDRFATAADVASSAYSSASTVYLATGENFPDALSGGPVAGYNAAPVLLVMGDSIPAATRSELIALNPSKIVIIGGTSAVDSAVQALL